MKPIALYLVGGALLVLAGCGGGDEQAGNAPAPATNQAGNAAGNGQAATGASGALPGDAALLAGPDRPAPQVVDIRGMRLGMTTEQARAAFRASGLPPLDSENEWIATGVRVERPAGADDLAFNSVMMTGSTQPSERLYALFTPTPGRERVWGIGYYRVYRAGEMPLESNVYAQLTAKYGAPGGEPNLGGMREGGGDGHGVIQNYWYWNDAGQRHDNAASVCTDPFTLILPNGGDRNARNSASTAPTVFDRGRAASCGRVIYARWVTNSDGMISEIFIGALDYPAAHSTGTAFAAQLAGRSNAAQQRRRDAANRNQPAL